MNTSEPLVYLNGRMLPASQASLPLYDAGVVMGASVTEMTRTFNHRPFRLDDHLARLFHSLNSVRFVIHESKEQLAAISRELIAQNAALLPAGGERGLNLFITAGTVATYAGMARDVEAAVRDASTSDRISERARSDCTVCVNTFPLEWKLYARKMREGAHVVISDIRSIPPECLDPAIKCRSRMHFYLADQDVRQADANATALLLDLDGNITETSAANFLFVESGTIVSPTTRNILPGISRRTVIELANNELRIPFVEQDSQQDRVIRADEAFLTSTPYCLMPVTKINGTTIGDGKPGPIFRRLLTAWSALVGVDIEQQILKGATS